MTSTVDASALPSPVPGPQYQEGALIVPLGQRDPYIDECPAWCEGFHTVTTHESDRRHHGLAMWVLVRSLPTRYSRAHDGGSVVFGDVCMSLERPAQHRDPRIRLQTMARRPLLLSIKEAEQIADSLIALVKESQR